jgi:hypothetical protein
MMSHGIDPDEEDEGTREQQRRGDARSLERHVLVVPPQGARLTALDFPSAGGLFAVV